MRLDRPSASCAVPYTKPLVVRYRTKLLRPSLVSGSILSRDFQSAPLPRPSPCVGGASFCQTSGMPQDGRSSFPAVTRAKRKRVCRGFLSGQRSGSVPIRRLAGLVAVRVIGVPTAAADSIMRRSRVARQRYLLSGAKGKAPRTRPHQARPRGLLRGSPWGAPPRLWVMITGVS